MWKQSKENLQNNETVSLRSLQNLIAKLQKSPDLLETYDKIISNQLKEGIVEKLNKSIPLNIPESYLPYTFVVRENAASTKVRVVTDASARADNQSKSLNEYLEPGKIFQNQIWKILTRTRFNPVAICGDLKQELMQIRIQETYRDALRFRDPQMYRFPRLVFGLAQSPFVLGTSVQHQLQNYTNTLKN